MKINFIRTLMVSTLVAGATIFTSCDEDAGITVNIPQTQEVIYQIPPVSTNTISKVDTLESKLDSLLTANSATQEDITEITLTALTLSFTDKNGLINPSQNFNNVKSVGINIAEIGGTFSAIQGIDSATMSAGYRNINPIVFPSQTVNPNILPFVSQDFFRVQLDGKLFAPTTDTLYIKSIMTFQIGVTL